MKAPYFVLVEGRRGSKVLYETLAEARLEAIRLFSLEETAKHNVLILGTVEVLSRPIDV